MTASGEEMIVEAEAGYGTQLIGRRIRFGNGLSGAAAESGEPVVANNVAEDARYIRYRDGMRSAVSLPLRYREELIGVLTLESKQHNAFSAHDVLTLRTLADQLAVALHNAQAYQKAMEQAITDGLTGLGRRIASSWNRSTASGARQRAREIFFPSSRSTSTSSNR